MDRRDLAEAFLNQISDTRHIRIDRSFNRMVQGDSFVLNYLFMNGKKAHPKEISRAMAVSSARIAKILHDLTLKGLIARSIDDTDYRKIFIVLTEKGENCVEELRDIAISKIEEGFSPLDEKDIEDLIRIREKMAKARIEKNIL